MMPIQQSADVTRRIPLGNTARNLLPLLNIYLRKSAHSALAYRSTNPQNPNRVSLRGSEPEQAWK